MNLITDLTLETISVGVKTTNFKILKMLPTEVKKIMREFDFNKVSANYHINELEKFGLLERERSTGNLYPTNLTKVLLKSVEKFGKNNVVPKINMVKKKLER